MTANERATKIVLELQHFANDTEKNKIAFVLTEIEAAQKEVRGERDKAFVGMMLRAKREGIRAGFQAAKEMANDVFLQGLDHKMNKCCDRSVLRIWSDMKAMKPEEPK